MTNRKKSQLPVKVKARKGAHQPPTIHVSDKHAGKPKPEVQSPIPGLKPTLERLPARRKRRYTLEVREEMRKLKKADIYPAVRLIAQALGISLKKVCACRQKIRRRKPDPRRQTRLKDRFDVTGFVALTFVLILLVVANQERRRTLVICHELFRQISNRKGFATFEERLSLQASLLKRHGGEPDVERGLSNDDLERNLLAAIQPKEAG